MDLSVKGANQLADLARDLKSEANGREIRRDLLKGIRDAAKPLAKEAAPKAAREGLPKKGGLNEYVASSKFAVRTRTSGKSAGVRIVGSKPPKHDLAAMDRGALRHKVYGHDVWVHQSITPGWWTDGMSDEVVLAAMRKEVLAVLDEVARRIARG